MTAELADDDEVDEDSEICEVNFRNGDDARVLFDPIRQVVALMLHYERDDTVAAKCVWPLCISVGCCLHGIHTTASKSVTAEPSLTGAAS